MPHLRVLALVALLAVPSLVRAEQVRYHFVPVDAYGKTAQVPAGPDGTIGELKRTFGARSLPYPYAARPTHVATFRHPATGRNITVPLRLPEGPPRLAHQADRIIYNYNDYTVDVRFLADGSVDVVYNSGLARPLQLTTRSLSP